MNRKKLSKINLLVDQGYDFVDDVNPIEACNCWLRAWVLVKELKRPEMRLTESFSYVYYHYLYQPLEYWTDELAVELHNAGLDDPHYHELRLQYIDDYFEQFPDELKENAVTFLPGKGEALWQLGRREEAEAQYAAIVKNYPDDAWGYIGWSDEYWLLNSSAKDYAKAEAILLQALERPTLADRLYALERLHSLYEEWEKDEEAAQVAQEMEKARNQRRVKQSRLPEYIRHPPPIPDELLYPSSLIEEVRKRPQQLGRNEPCWCGSGKKYKKCHWLANQS